MRVHKFLERKKLRPPQGEPGRHGMAATRFQKILRARGADEGAKIDPGNRACRASSDGLITAGPESRDEYGLCRAFLEPAGNDSDLTRVPAMAADENERALALSQGHGLGRFQDNR